jgi:hypothetical protein
MFALSLILAGGCSAGKGTLFGRVTYQGKAVVYGTVMAIGSDGITRSANIEPDGAYRFDNVLPIGEVKLAVVSPEPPDPAASRHAGQRGPPPAPRLGTQAVTQQWFKIPDYFTDPRNSDLKASVSGEAKAFDIALD